MVLVNPGEEILAAHINAKLDADGSNVKATANFIPETGSSYDLGLTGTRWKDLFLSGNANVTGNITTGASLFLGVISSDPGSPSEGEMWYNSTDKQFKGYNGTSTVIIG